MPRTTAKDGGKQPDREAEGKVISSSKEGKRKAQQISSAVEDSVKQLLECPICCETMCPPIFQCKDGHSICNGCVRRVQKCPTCRCSMHSNPIRNISLEQMAENCDGFPCTFAPHGCTMKFRYSELAKHQATCEHRPFGCPHGESRIRPCLWQGSGGESGIVHHLKTAHTETFLSLSSVKAAGGPSKKRGPQEWAVSFSVGEWQRDFAQNLAVETPRSKAYFRLQHVWKRFPDKRSCEYRSFITIRYLGEQSENTWFAELLVGPAQSDEEDATSSRCTIWNGRIHSSRYPMSDLEERGEGLYLNTKQLHFLTSAVSLRDGKALATTGPLRMTVTLHRDAKLARSPLYSEPMPAGEIPSQPPSSARDESSSSRAFLS